MSACVRAPSDFPCTRGRPCHLVHPRPTSARAALYMAAPVATKRDAVIGAFYHRLLAAGKPKKLALVACMRKLLTMLDARAKTRQRWQERPAAA